MKRISLSLLIAFVLTLITSSVALGESLLDIGESKYKAEIEKLVEEEIILGYPDKTFKPEGTITREELASILVKALRLEVDKEVGKQFIDVQGSWAEGIVGAIYNKGIMIGKSKTEFGAKDNITKEEIAVLLLRAFGLEDLSRDLNLEPPFVDNEVIGIWAKHQVAFAYKIKLMYGNTNEDGTISFNPKSTVDRQTVAKLVYELIFNHDAYKEIANTIKGDFDVKKDDIEENKEESEIGTPSYESIVSKYTSKLSSLQSKYSGILDSLISQAKSEYERNKDNPDFSVTELYQRYEGIARGYESQADSEVSSILSQLASELIQYGYDTSIVDDLQSQYEATKNAIEIQL